MEKSIATQFQGEMNAVVFYDESETCPLCHYAILPNLIGTLWYRDNGGKRHLAILYTCPHCCRPFVAHFIDSDPEGKTMQPQLDYCGPKLYSEQQFDVNIQGLSPQFVKIYNQAFEAENQRLDEIAGIGYRKALEFLVKDYCKHQYPDKTDEIESTWLKTCIIKFIPQQSIKTLASRAAWIGNDEAHYTRKHEDRDIADMKSFIQAMVHFIGMELVLEDAASMEPAH